MKKVLMIAIHVTKGGMERQLSSFLNSFDQTKLDITLALYHNRIEYDIPAHIKIIDLGKKGKFDFIFYYKLFKLIGSKQFDIINSKISGLNEPIMLICGLTNRKNVVVEIRSSGTRLIKYYKRMKLLSSVFKKKWTVVCNTYKACSEIKQYLPANCNIIYVNNGINTEKFFYRPIQLRNTFSIGFVGRIEAIKNIETLIKAFNIFQRTKTDKMVDLKIIGSKNMEYYNNLNSLIENFNLKEKIAFLNSVDNIENYYSQFDLLVLPSHFEGAPNALIEAMSCGCICLISKNANSDNFVEERFEFETIDFKELSEKMEWIYNMNEEQKAEIRTRNREYVIQNYSIDKMSFSLTEVFLNLK